MKAKMKMFWLPLVAAGVASYFLLRPPAIEQNEKKEISKTAVVKKTITESPMAQSQNVRKTEEKSEPQHDTTSSLQPSLKPTAETTHITNRDDSIQKAQARMEARMRYLEERRKWRRALNEALLEAKKTGDYSKYDLVKEMEPDKESFLK
jgi:hypothetical protein